MNPAVFILSILDILAGLLVFSSYSGLEGLFGKIVLYAAVFHIVKGAWSVFTSYLMGFFFDVLGWIDFIAGILILLALYGFAFHFAYVVAIIIVIKGLYCILFSL